MARQKTENPTSCYVNNEELRNLIREYNNNNIYDDLEWCANYIKKLNRQLELGKIDEEKHKLAISFINRKRETRDRLMKRYRTMSDSEKIQFEDNLTFVRDTLFKHFTKIINGRINSLRIRKTISDPSEVEDMVSNALIALFSYINRYDADRSTSAFAYVTQIAHNSVIQDLNSYNARKQKFVSGLDFFDNINTIDDYREGSNFDKWIDE